MLEDHGKIVGNCDALEIYRERAASIRIEADSIQISSGFFEEKVCRNTSNVQNGIRTSKTSSAADGKKLYRKITLL